MLSFGAESFAFSLLSKNVKINIHRTVICLLFCVTFFLFLLAQELPTGPGSPHSRDFYITHNDAPQSVGLIWTRDQLLPNRPLPDNTQRSNIYVPGGIRTHNLRRRAAADLRLRPRGHWDHLTCVKTPTCYTML